MDIELVVVHQRIGAIKMVIVGSDCEGDLRIVHNSGVLVS